MSDDFDQGFDSQASGIFRLPISDYSARNSYLADVLYKRWRLPYSVRPAKRNAGPWPGTACKGVSAFVRHAARVKQLDSLLRHRVKNIVSLCESPVADSSWPFAFDDEILWAYQNEVKWENPKECQFFVGVAGGQICYQSQTLKFKRAYAELGGSHISNHSDDFAIMFACMLFKMHPVLVAYKNIDTTVTFELRLAMVHEKLKAL